jgi:hypothetical protein
MREGTSGRLANPILPRMEIPTGYRIRIKSRPRGKVLDLSDS